MKVTEEWIEERADELVDGLFQIDTWGEEMKFTKDFIRSLVKEIEEVEETASNARDAYGGYREDE